MPSAKPPAKAASTKRLSNKPAAPAKEKTESSKKAPQPLQLVRGMRDILPMDYPYWKRIQDAVESVSRSYGYDHIEIPVIEDQKLFVRGVGTTTDIVEKELFSWETPGGEQVALRPEGTASVVRAFIQHGLWNQPQPMKLWYSGPMFRYDRPQAGRFRQFYQAGFECLGGDGDAVVDAQLIIMSWNILTQLGLDPVVRVNSLGTPESRANYKQALTAFFRSKKNQLSEDDKRRLAKNPLRLLDSKDPLMVELRSEAPQMVDWLDEDSKAHFMRVLEYLDEVGVRYELDPYLVRGLDYYTKTVFEWYASSEDGELAQSAIGGGGRYDGLVESLGGQPTAAAGMAFGLDRIASRLKEMDAQHGNVPVSSSMAPVEIFLAQLGEMGRKRALVVFEEFRKAGIHVGEAFSKSSIKAQMDLANRRQAKWAIVIGQKEVLDGTAVIRDMDAGTQETVDVKKLIAEMKKKLS